MKCLCGADLSAKNAVRREYINKDEDGSVFGFGHLIGPDYEPDSHVDLSDGRYDLVDGSDTCNNCGEVLG